MSNIEWYELTEVDEKYISFVVLLACYKGQIIIINNKTRSGWELPGGRREANEEILLTAGRELYEETGAIEFVLEPYGIFTLNGFSGMAYYANVLHLGELPDYEVDEIKLVNQLPEGMNFGNIYYCLLDKWNTYMEKGRQQEKLRIKNNKIGRA